MQTFIGFKDALDLTLSQVTCGISDILPLDRLVGRVLAEDVVARVDCPSISTSRKDGYAVVSSDLTQASEQNPISLKVHGSLSAGGRRQLKINRGQTVRVTTGAPLPEGADAVLSEEFCRSQTENILAFNTAEAGRNIHHRAKDIRTGEMVARKNMRLHPALIGLLAAAGLDGAAVFQSPHVAVIATGDEVITPGNPLLSGQLYASNMVEICAWLSQLGLPYTMELVPDSRQAIEKTITKNLQDVDVFLTSGGAWGSERDLILDVVSGLDWQGVYHRVRMGPGKPVGFGLLGKKPFFCLPGGPPSNEMAFLQLALPALLKMQGHPPFYFPLTTARLAADVYGKKEWTDFIHARLEKRKKQLWVHPARLKSALQSMATKEALIIIPEDREKIAAGETIEIQLLSLDPLRSLANQKKSV
jgi:molybdopterin molybdotransferase